jgi:hypothetical protein
LLLLYLDQHPVKALVDEYKFLCERVFLMPPNRALLEKAKSWSGDDYFNARPHKTKVILAQEEGSLASVAETMVPVRALNVKKYIVIGDHLQLPPNGIGSDEKKKIAEEIERYGLRLQTGGMHESMAALNRIFTDEALAETKVSLLEQAHYYGQAWRKGRTFVLHVIRRGIWIFTRVFARFYDNEGVKLFHRDHEKKLSDWEKIEEDKYRIVDVTTTYEERWGTDNGHGDGNYSLQNFGEVGQVLEQTMYYLNRGFEPKDILIITPYRAQNALIEDTLQLVAYLNQYEDDGEMKPETYLKIRDFFETRLFKQINEYSATVPRMDSARITRLRQLVERIRSLKGETAGKARQRLIDDIYAELSPIYAIDLQETLLSRDRRLMKKDILTPRV